MKLSITHNYPPLSPSSRLQSSRVPPKLHRKPLSRPLVPKTSDLSPSLVLQVSLVSFSCKNLLLICLDFSIWGWEIDGKEGWEEQRDEGMGVGKNNEGMVSPGFSPNVPMRISQIPRSILPPNRPNHSLLLNSKQKLQHGFQRFGLSVAKPTRSLCTKAVLSEIPNQELYGKVGANSTGPIPIGQLIGAVEKAAKTGAEIFNKFNARMPDKFNIFQRITKNFLFMGIVTVTLVLQIIIVQFLGKFAKTEPLTWDLWLISAVIAFISWPLAVVGKLIPVPETPLFKYFTRMIPRRIINPEVGRKCEDILQLL